MKTFWPDIQHAWRSLARNPGPAWLAVATLVLGIGANSAVFSVVHAVLLRSLPFPNPEQVVMLRQSNPGLGLSRYWISPANYLDLRDQNRVFAQLAAYGETEYNVTGAMLPLRARVTDGSTNFFDTFSAKPQRGRTFLPGC